MFQCITRVCRWVNHGMYICCVCCGHTAQGQAMNALLVFSAQAVPNWVDLIMLYLDTRYLEDFTKRLVFRLWCIWSQPWTLTSPWKCTTTGAPVLVVIIMVLRSFVVTFACGPKRFSSKATPIYTAPGQAKSLSWWGEIHKWWKLRSFHIWWIPTMNVHLWTHSILTLQFCNKYVHEYVRCCFDVRCVPRTWYNLWLSQLADATT